MPRLRSAITPAKIIPDTVPEFMNLTNYRMKLFINSKVHTTERVQQYLDLFKIRMDGHPYQLEVIDILEQPDICEKEHIIAIPLLIRYQPPPVKRILGELAKVEEAIDQILDQ